MVTSLPSTRISPEVGSINLFKCLISVDFPDPDKPIQTNVSPSSIFKDTLSKPTVCPVFSRTSSFVAPSCTILRTLAGFGPKILYTLLISILDIYLKFSSFSTSKQINNKITLLNSTIN